MGDVLDTNIQTDDGTDTAKLFMSDYLSKGLFRNSASWKHYNLHF